MNLLGDVIFQGQLRKGLSEFIAKDKQKPYQGSVTVAVKGSKEIIKCIIIFKNNSDAVKFNKAFTKAILELPDKVEKAKKERKEDGANDVDKSKQVVKKDAQEVNKAKLNEAA
eukprot:TRINITY_DN7928_c0_g1_i32.p2 TRINITY_DN7928_c0_g1~~TRINITY_DN7928_c0_g1_i32.p2  ORF type:complete len:113 (-),score=24.63 TRINITY_DN7928_c0_g1_i32:142-480(-)